MIYTYFKGDDKATLSKATDLFNQQIIQINIENKKLDFDDINKAMTYLGRKGYLIYGMQG